MTGAEEGVAKAGVRPDCQVWRPSAPSLLWPLPCKLWVVGVGPLGLDLSRSGGEEPSRWVGAMFVYKSFEESDGFRQIQVLPALLSGKPTFTSAM